MASLSWARSVVGETRVFGSEAKDTTPIRMPAGIWSMNEMAAALAASRRVGETSVARMEPEMSIASRTVASSRGVAMTMVGRARPMSSAAIAPRYRTGGTWRRQAGSASGSGWRAGPGS